MCLLKLSSRNGKKCWHWLIGGTVKTVFVKKKKKYLKGKNIKWTNTVLFIHLKLWLSSDDYLHFNFLYVSSASVSFGTSGCTLTYGVHAAARETLLSRDPVHELAFFWMPFVYLNWVTVYRFPFLSLSLPWVMSFQADKRMYCNSAHKGMNPLLLVHTSLTGKITFESRTHSVQLGFRL